MNIDFEFLRTEQQRLSKQVHLQQHPIELAPYDFVFGVDIQYVDEQAFCAISVFSLSGRHEQTFLMETQAGIPYQSGFFCFREGPPVLRSLRKVIAQHGLMPKLVIIDGHGLAHPRKFGVACWLGVQSNLPTIGIAKRPLLKYEGELNASRGATLPLTIKGQTVGAVVRSQTDIKPIFVSPGYLVPVQQAIDLSLQLAPDYRVVEPIRQADQAARAFAKGQSFPKTTIL